MQCYQDRYNKQITILALVVMFISFADLTLISLGCTLKCYQDRYKKQTTILALVVLFISFADLTLISLGCILQLFGL